MSILVFMKKLYSLPMIGVKPEEDTRHILGRDALFFLLNNPQNQRRDACLPSLPLGES